jgi:NAD(P)-dependent dehydrogenase (short-subunit alcohol dehydrogenase family)
MTTRDLEGRTILITGSNTGIGRATAVLLARRGARLYLLGRSKERMQPVIDEIRSAGNEQVFYIPLDLGDLASVRACAESFLATGDPVHVLINNAGLAGRRGLTKDGFELTFGTNHLGPFLLTELLLERLKESAPSRIVNVSSQGHYRVKRIDFDALKRPTESSTGLAEYNVSKLCNVLHAKELGRRLEGTGVTTYALHPGVIASDVWREVPWLLRSVMKLMMRSNEEGAATSIWCATAPELAEQTGRYYDDRREKEPSVLARDEALARELWRRSVEWSGATTAAPASVRAPAA